MSGRSWRLIMAIVLSLVLGLAATGCGSGSDTGTTNQRDASDPAKSLVDSKCSMCHSLDRVYSVDKTAAEWESTIDRMKSNGLVVTDEEYAQIVEYLAN